MTVSFAISVGIAVEIKHLDYHLIFNVHSRWTNEVRTLIFFFDNDVLFGRKSPAIDH